MDAQERVTALAGRLVESGEETGMQVAAYLAGELVVDVCAGLADQAAGRTVDQHTLFHSWSAGKGQLSTAVHVAAERGLVRYDAPIAGYWPEFAARGKQDVTVAQVLTHSAGIPQAPAGLAAADLAEWHGMCRRIADLPLRWKPGTATGYHALTFGFVLGEVLRRVTGRPVSQVLREDVAEPLGIADGLFFGVPVEQLHRVARLEDGNWAETIARRPAESLFFAAAPAPVQPSPELGNRPAYLAADIPCAGTMTARAAARMYSALIGEVDGVRLISPERANRIAEVATADVDRVLGVPVPKGLGYFLGLPETGPSAGAFGCKGSGGSVAFADPARGFAFAFTHNRLAAPPSDCAVEIAQEVREALRLDG